MACPNFKALQKLWYQKLKESGFHDIEDTDSPQEYLKTWHSNYFFCRYTPESFAAKADYYRLVSHFLYDHDFDTPLEREIWKDHSEGLTLRATAKHLRTPKLRLNKDSVHKVISKYLRIMKTSTSHGGH